MRFNRKSMQYRPKFSAINEVLRNRIKELAQARVRYGYRRIHVLLRREVGRLIRNASPVCTDKKA